jgi:hypothetical protein
MPTRNKIDLVSCEWRLNSPMSSLGTIQSWEFLASGSMKLCLIRSALDEGEESFAKRQA